MSVTFTGTCVFGVGTRRVHADSELEEDSVGFNLANGNARAFLNLLGYDSEELYGGKPIAEMVRAVQRAKELFVFRVDACTRKSEEGTGGRGCRYFIAGIDETYLERRRNEFSELLADWIERGADAVSWG